MTGDPQASWGASLLLWRDGAPVERLALAFEAAKGSLQVDSLSGVTRALVVVTQKKFKTHNPDNQNYVETRHFELSIDSPLGLDAGLPDASADAGTPDASGQGQAAPRPDPDSGACGCRAAGGEPPSFFPKLVLGLGLIAVTARVVASRRRRASRNEEKVR